MALIRRCFRNNISDTLSKSLDLFQNGLGRLLGDKESQDDKVDVAAESESDSNDESSKSGSLSEDLSDESDRSDDSGKSLSDDFSTVEEMVEYLNSKDSTNITLTTVNSFENDPYVKQIKAALNQEQIPDNWWRESFSPRVIKNKQEALIYAPDIDVCRMHQIYRSILVQCVETQLTCLSRGHDDDQAEVDCELTGSVERMVRVAKDIGMKMDDIDQWADLVLAERK